MLNVEERVRELSLNHVFNIHHGSAPSYLNVNFTSVSFRYARAPSNEDLLYLVSRHVKPTHFTIMAF